MVIDSATILTGSFNFTKAAEAKNAENLLVITDAPALVTAYEENIRLHTAHSHPYTRAGAPACEAIAWNSCSATWARYSPSPPPPAARLLPTE